jgi:hypothetical protein
MCLIVAKSDRASNNGSFVYVVFVLEGITSLYYAEHIAKVMNFPLCINALLYVFRFRNKSWGLGVKERMKISRDFKIV